MPVRAAAMPIFAARAALSRVLTKRHARCMIRARGLIMKKILTLFLTFFKIGAFTFGGGYAMLALLENELVDKKKWLTA